MILRDYSSIKLTFKINQSFYFLIPGLIWQTWGFRHIISSVTAKGSDYEFNYVAIIVCHFFLYFVEVFNNFIVDSNICMSERNYFIKERYSNWITRKSCRR